MVTGTHLLVASLVLSSPWKFGLPESSHCSIEEISGSSMYRIWMANEGKPPPSMAYPGEYPEFTFSTNGRISFEHEAPSFYGDVGVFLVDRNGGVVKGIVPNEIFYIRVESDQSEEGLPVDNKFEIRIVMECN